MTSTDDIQSFVRAAKEERLTVNAARKAAKRRGWRLRYRKHHGATIFDASGTFIWGPMSAIAALAKCWGVPRRPGRKQGFKVSEQTRAKIAAAKRGKRSTGSGMRGRHHSPETRAKIGASLEDRHVGAAEKGHRNSAETRAKKSAAAKTQAAAKIGAWSPEARAKMAATNKAKSRKPNRKPSDEAILMLSALAKAQAAAKKGAWSPEARAKMAATNKAKIAAALGMWSPEAIAKSAATRRGRKLSELPSEIMRIIQQTASEHKLVLDAEPSKKS
jgi:hypothetical protein